MHLCAAPHRDCCTPRSQHPRKPTRFVRVFCAVEFQKKRSRCLRIADPVDYWPVSGLHCEVFYPDLKSIQYGGSLLQAVGLVDRVLACQVNDKIAAKGIGKCAMLIAESSSGPCTPLELPKDVMQCVEFLKYQLPAECRDSVGCTYQSRGIAGVINVDTFGDSVPPRALDPGRDQAFGYIKRDGIAYISNMAVSPSFRRQGIGLQLVEEAEHMAALWGARSVGLHCNPDNTPARQLYLRLGYRDVALEPPWMPILQTRPGKRCMFMVKRLRPRNV